MSTTTYDLFLPEVLPFAHGCSDMVATHAVKNAAIEFCEKTDWWLYELSPITGVANQQDYTFASLPAGASVCRVVQADYGNLPLDPLTDDELRGVFGIAWRSVDAGWPRFTTQINEDQISLVPAPSSASIAQLTAFVSLRPTRASTGCDSSIYERWGEVVGQGALARLYATAGQPYSNPAAAAAYMAKFNVGCSEAKRMRMRGLGRAGGRVQMRPFV